MNQSKGKGGEGWSKKDTQIVAAASILKQKTKQEWKMGRHMEALSDISSDRKSTLKRCSSPRRFGFCTTERINRRGPYAGKTRKHMVELKVETVVVVVVEVVHHAAVATCHHCTRTFSSNWRLLWTDSAVRNKHARAHTHTLGVDCAHGWKKKCCLSMNERRNLSCAGAHDKIRLACVSTITMALIILEECY